MRNIYITVLKTTSSKRTGGTAVNLTRLKYLVYNKIISKIGPLN